ncbi:MAG TPA: T9SS type B sorting domain-containing protein [Leeuwenhoekiella sp.]|nr:T9SS type B sorting domain-containing protein [Leeuwenhoekiella sp.]
MKITFIILVFISLNVCYAQTQIGQDIDGEAPENSFGNSVSLSSNGSIVAIGGYRNAENGRWSGHVQVYQNVNDNWVQIGQDINGDGPDQQFGYSVSLSANGDILAIGALTGSAKVYQNQNDDWVQIGSTLFGGSSDNFGNSVSLNSDGNILAIGAPADTNKNGINAGSARVYENLNGNWIQIGSTIDGGEGNNDRFGHSVRLSGDGSILAVGAIQNFAPGFVKIFENQGGNWVQLGSNIVGQAAGDNYGFSVDLSANGTSVAIGSENASAGAGHVRIYKYQSNAWGQIGNTIIGENSGDSSGDSVSLNDDGAIVAIGAPGNSDQRPLSGHARVFENQGGNWVQLGEDIDGEGSIDLSGFSVSLNAEGSVLAVGAPFNDGINGEQSGHVRVYDMGPRLTAPIFDSVVSICEGDTLNPLPTTSNNGITGSWSPAIDNTQTTTYTFTPDSGQLARATTFTIEVNERVTPEFDSIMPICAGDMLTTLPTTSNNGIIGTWSPTLDNTQTTTYTFTPNAEECSISTVLIIEVNELVTPEFDSIVPICAGGTLNLLPTTSNNGITGTWSPILDNTQTTMYTFTPNSSACTSTTQLEIIVNEIDELEIMLEVLSAPSSNFGIKANVSGGSGYYEYQLDDGFWVTSNVFNDLNDCDQYTISVRDINGCGTEASAVIQILIYPKYFTPNGDGVNERWNIKCLSYQPLAKIYIFDRYGKLLNKISPSGMGWDGTYKGKALPSNDYWFVAEYLDDLNIKKTFKSHITLKR